MNIQKIVDEALAKAVYPPYLVSGKEELYGKGPADNALTVEKLIAAKRMLEKNDYYLRPYDFDGCSCYECSQIRAYKDRYVMPEWALRPVRSDGAVVGTTRMG